MKLDHRLVISATAVLAAALPLAAGAQSKDGPYIGATLGYASIDVGLTEWNNALSGLPVPSGSSITSSSVSKGDFAWGINAGYQFIPYFAVELGYLDLAKSTGDVTATIGGRPGTGRADIKSSGIETAAIGIIPLESGWAIDGRLGLYFGDNKVQANGSTGAGSFSYENSANKSSFMGGVGVSYTFLQNSQIRFDYLYIDKVGDAGTLRYTAPADMFSVGYRFTW